MAEVSREQGWRNEWGHVLTFFLGKDNNKVAMPLDAFIEAFGTCVFFIFLKRIS
jgi:hypothetical protein